MRISRTPLVPACAGLAAVAVALLVAAPAAAATPGRYAVTTDPVQAAAGWLSTQFVDKTHLPSPKGDHFDSKFGDDFFPNYGENADVIFGLAAAKAGGSKIQTALGYLAANVNGYADPKGTQGGPYDGSLGKLAVAAIVGGADPTSFGGVNLIAALKTDECTAASPPPAKPSDLAGPCAAVGAARNIFASISESFVVLAEARVGGTSAPTTDALSYLTSLQCASGGFTDKTAACGSGAADIDSTSYAIMALDAVGGHDQQLAKAVKWLAGQQKAAGYWVSQGGPNPNSTGLAAAALRSQGVDVAKARSWLRAQQARRGTPGAGAMKYTGTVSPTTTSATSLSVLATAQALTGLVDGGSLATLTAEGAFAAAPMFAPAAALSAQSVVTGHRQTARGTGFVAGEKVRVTIHSRVVTVGTATADPIGTVEIGYRVPTSIAAGAHTVTLTGLTSGLTVDRPLTVTAAPSATTPSATSSTASSTSNVAAGSTDPIAATGSDGRRMLELSVAGLLAVLAGVGLLVVGRRRED